jgi:hypothetical protein
VRDLLIYNPFRRLYLHTEIAHASRFVALVYSSKSGGPKRRYLFVQNEIGVASEGWTRKRKEDEEGGRERERERARYSLELSDRQRDSETTNEGEPRMYEMLAYGKEATESEARNARGFMNRLNRFARIVDSFRVR